jgi:hypothetical protein
MSDERITVAQLKERIAGNPRAGKVNAFDPAAASLGTDDEAGGAAPTAEEVTLAAARETPKERRHTLISARPEPEWRPYRIYAFGAAATVGILAVFLLLS